MHQSLQSVSVATRQSTHKQSVRPNLAPCSQHGFTLIELLVVVSIIAVLASLLMTGISLVRNQATRVLCLSNLRQWGLAALGFAQDHRGIMPNSITYWDGPQPNFGKTPYAAWKVPMPGLKDELTYSTMMEYLEADPSQPTTLAKIWTCPSTSLAGWDQTQLVPSYPCLWMNYTWFALRETPPAQWCNVPEEIIIRRPRANQVLAGDMVSRYMTGIFFYQHGGAEGQIGIPELTGFPGANQLFGDGRTVWRPAKEWPLADMRYNSIGGRYLGDNNNNRAYF